MALRIELLRKELEGGEYISAHRLCVTDTDEIVGETDPRARRLLVGVGGTLTRQQAEHYGLVVPDALGSESTRSSDEGRGQTQKRRKGAPQDKRRKQASGNKEL